MHERFGDLENRNQRPFAEPLIDDKRGKKGRLFALPSHPEVVIRRDKVDISSSEKVDAVVERLRKTKELFTMLREQDGMYVAKAEYALGEGPDGGETYGIVESITGNELSKLTSLDAEAQKEVDECFVHYLHHVSRILHTGGMYWSDMNLSQVVYGTKDGDPTPHAYVVDLDPFTQAWMTEEERRNDPPQASSQVNSLLHMLTALHSSILSAERKLSKGESLERARAQFQNVLTQIDPVIASLPSDIKASFEKLENYSQEKL